MTSTFTFPDGAVINLAIIGLVLPLQRTATRGEWREDVPERVEVMTTRRRLWYAPWQQVTTTKEAHTLTIQRCDDRPDWSEYEFTVLNQRGRTMKVWPPPMQTYVSDHHITHFTMWSPEGERTVYEPTSRFAGSPHYRLEPVTAVRQALLTAWKENP